MLLITIISTIVRVMSFNSVKLAIYVNVPPIRHRARLKNYAVIITCLNTEAINRTNQTSGQYNYLFYKHSLHKTNFSTTDHINILCLNTFSL